MNSEEIDRFITAILESIVDICQRVEALERRYNDTTIPSTMPTNDPE